MGGDYLRASDGNGEAVRAVVVVNREVGDMLINVDSVLNWPAKFIATSGTIDPLTQTLDPDTITVFYGSLSGSMIHIDEFAPGYYDTGHQEEQYILLKPTTPWSDAVAEIVEVNTGPAGPANTLAIGTVVDGTPAAATITGTAPNQTLNLTLPKGDQGDPGNDIELQSNGTYIQWRYVGGPTWTNLVALSALVGPQGDPGDEIELQRSGAYLQWRYVGGSWTNLLPLSDITGPMGVGVPTGGTVGQTLLKNSSADYDFSWNVLPTAPVTSVAGKVGAVTLDAADLTATGITSAKYLRGDNTWQTPPNTTYAEISEAEITAGTASTLRTITGRRMQFLFNKVVDYIQANVFLWTHPVGCVYTSTVATNPGDTYGGTWVAYGEGRVIVGKASSGTFSTAGATGGAETHTLTVAEMPSHNHTTVIQQTTDASSAGGQNWRTTGSLSSNNPTGYTGGGGAHNNLQPYIVAYVWNRTA